MKFEETEFCITEEEFCIFEAKIGKRLPEAFRLHYLANNGGYPAGIERVKGKTHIFPFHGFFSIKYGRSTIEEMIKDLRDDFNLTNIVPFAYDQGSNIFYLSYEENPPWKVYQVDSENIERFFVSDSFYEFIAGLTSVDG